MPKRRRVQIVTGSPHPSRMMASAKRVAPKKRDHLRPEPLGDSEYWRELGEDAWHLRLANDRYPADMGMPLADFECSHGALGSDTNITCDCWKRPTEQLPKDLLEEVGHVNERKVRTE